MYLEVKVPPHVQDMYSQVMMLNMLYGEYYVSNEPRCYPGDIFPEVFPKCWLIDDAEDWAPTLVDNTQEAIPYEYV